MSNKMDELMGFPGDSVVKSPPARAEDGFNPWSWKIPQASEQLNPYAIAIEPVL